MIVRPLTRGILDAWQYGAAASAFVPITATGGTITDVEIGGRLYRVHTLLSSGDFVVTDLGSDGGAARRLLVAGGASGAAGRFSSELPGSGAGGEVLDDTITLTVGTHAAVVGAGGASVSGNVDGLAGSNTSFFGASVGGGGPGGKQVSAGGNAVNGGGGGAGASGAAGLPGGTGTRNGGAGDGGISTLTRGTGAGAGAATAGGNATDGKGGKAGDGVPSDIDGTEAYYGAGAPGIGNTAGDTGLGSVAGVIQGVAGNPGTDGLGNGGTGSAGSTSGKGANGVVKVAYPLEAA